MVTTRRPRTPKKRTKRQKVFDEKIEKKQYTLSGAIETLKNVPPAQFDQTVELAFKLNVNPKESSVSVRGTVSLPHGTGKTRRVAVFCKPEHEEKARAAGADFTGSDELVKKVGGGWCDFDVAIATPDMMKDLGRLGKVLGPRGLMPNPKTGTVTNDLEKAIKEIKRGKIEFRMDKQGNVHAPVGKLSFDAKNLEENASKLIEAVTHTRPSTVKGAYIKGMAVSSTMGPGLRLDPAHWRSES